MKIYEKDALEKKEGIILRRLYLSQYCTKLFKKLVPFEVLVSELQESNISDSYVRKVLTELLEINGLKYHKSVNNLKHYYIDRNIIFRLLEKDETFKLDKNIFENTYYILEK